MTRGIQGVQGIQGIAGAQGESGQAGIQGESGHTGSQGEQGRRGSSAVPFGRRQAIAMFLLILITGAVLTWLGDKQTQRIEAQQIEIQANNDQIRDADYASCVSGLVIIKKYNAQQAALAAVERSLLTDPDRTALAKRVAEKRIKAYEAGTIPIDPNFKCVR